MILTCSLYMYTQLKSFPFILWFLYHMSCIHTLYWDQQIFVCLDLKTLFRILGNYLMSSTSNMALASWLTSYFLSCKSSKYDQHCCGLCVSGRIIRKDWSALEFCGHKTLALFRTSLSLVSQREESTLINFYVSPGRVTPGQLMSYIQLFKNNLRALTNHCGLLQLGMATVQTLKHPQTAKWDNFLAFERLLLQVCCCVNLTICY